MTNLSRRSFLGCSAGLAISAALGERLARAAVAADGGFRLGIQSYSLRAYKFPEALKHVQTLGLSHIEPYSKHVPISTVPSYISEQKALLEQHGITADAFGVVSFNDNENKAREAFEFASAMGLLSLSANPQKNTATFDLLEKLVDEYQIPIAIHNHGPGALYDKADDVVQWTKDRHPLIGACVDTGHYLRSNEAPEEVIERLGKRVFGCHLKDVRTIHDAAELERLMSELPKKRAQRLKNEGKVMTIVGEGELNIAAVLKALRAQDYERSLSLEYEENMENPLSDIAVCLDNVRAAIKSIG